MSWKAAAAEAKREEEEKMRQEVLVTAEAASLKRVVDEVADPSEQEVAAELRSVVDSADMESVAGKAFRGVSDELLTLEDLDMDYDPDEEFVFDGPDELMTLDESEFGVDDFVISKMEGPEAGAAALAALRNVSSALAEGREGAGSESGKADAATPPKLSKEELLEKWKARAATYQRNVDQASPDVIEVTKKYDKTAMGALAVADVVSALKDLDVVLEASTQSSILAGLERLPDDETKVSVNTFQQLAQRYRPRLAPLPSMPSVAGRVLEALGSAFKGAPTLVRRTFQDLDTRRSVLRELSSALVNTSEVKSSSSSEDIRDAGRSVRPSDVGTGPSGSGAASPSTPEASSSLRETRESSESPTTVSTPPPLPSSSSSTFPKFNLALRNGMGNAGGASQAEETKEAQQEETTVGTTLPVTQESAPSGLRAGDSQAGEKSEDVSSGEYRQGGGMWKAEIDPPTGKTYYWNTETRQVTWDKPSDMSQ